ncbi:SDR family NAD(P)-dependent oxidoreductase [Spirosoma sp. HMF3257]|uniref:Short-chain dehydrogenase/reductase n=1 Tax=Spirosoma telluris TaxID=2183553 RepID=A0A327NGV7_9BACT|nr:SDR family NAD(P)-dependent oxidoreductase [Spirosoma telluris]RAI74055.1 short-chain dehydrogenase/reductase [Spirosoma telluris]
MCKTILITGASSGIGKAAAKKFAGEGWNVIATMRKPEVEQELTRLENVFVTKLDVQQPDTIKQAINEGIARFGGIDAVINNAGYGQNGIFEAMTPAQIQQQFDVNVFGVMNVTRAILPHFRQQKAGLILTISSGAGRFTLPLLSMYCASKFALEGFSEALSFELAALNIRVKIIEPGGTTTNFSKVTQEQFAYNPELADYDAFTEAAGKLFRGMIAQRLVTADEVADVIYTAATDGTNTLRYVVGNDDFKKRIAARAQMPDQAYVDSVRQSFMQYMPQN